MHLKPVATDPFVKGGVETPPVFNYGIYLVFGVMYHPLCPGLSSRVLCWPMVSVLILWISGMLDLGIAVKIRLG